MDSWWFWGAWIAFGLISIILTVLAIKVEDDEDESKVLLSEVPYKKSNSINITKLFLLLFFSVLFILGGPLAFLMGGVFGFYSKEDTVFNWM